MPLAERGLAVTAVELGAALAALARARTAGFPLVSVVTSSFEDWQDTSAVPVRAVTVFNKPTVRSRSAHQRPRAARR